MVDIVSKKKRSSMMAGIKSKDTKPEVLIRKALFKTGIRYRLHSKKVAGKPDLFMPKHNAAIFINGCFWHAHENCHLYRLPKSRVDFWEDKLSKNKLRDSRVYLSLEEKGIRYLVIWECAIKGRKKIEFEELTTSIYEWITMGHQSRHIRGIDR